MVHAASGVEANSEAHEADLGALPALFSGELALSCLACLAQQQASADQGCDDLLGRQCGHIAEVSDHRAAGTIMIRRLNQHTMPASGRALLGTPAQRRQNFHSKQSLEQARLYSVKMSVLKDVMVTCRE